MPIDDLLREMVRAEVARQLAARPTPRPPDGPILLTVKQAAELLAAGESYVRARIADGTLRQFNLNLEGNRRAIRVRRDEVERFAASTETFGNTWSTRR